MAHLRRHATRIILGVAACIALAVALLLYEPPKGGIGQPLAPVNLTGPVQASNCLPCHPRLAEARVQGLVFSHGNHIVVACDACHDEMPHKDGRTTRVPMDRCMNCHGIAHGQQGEIATGKCEDCHTPEFKLRPRLHVKTWAKKPHAAYAKRNGVNRCMMCHDAPKDCDACHRKERVAVEPMPRVYQAILPVKRERAPVLVQPDESATMGQCVYCHPDLNAFKKGRLIFDHAVHVRQNFSCAVCHPEGGHGLGTVLRPDMTSCYRCHGLAHAVQGPVATEECSACHPKDFELKPPDHTPAFEQGTHKKRAARDPGYCAQCHQSPFCVECHMGRKRLATGKLSKKVIPADHRKVQWQGTHGQLFLAQKGGCNACHDSPSCTTCHQTPMPHETDWLKIHGSASRVGTSDCNVCHIDRRECQRCHHGNLQRAELIAKNCVGCHEEMRQKPATAIKNKGFAEHAVHFDVAEKKGRPYQCYDCHVDFGTVRPAGEQAGTSSHDLRLCYGCHGSLDVRNILIAPYGGAQLCLRCHTDLRL